MGISRFSAKLARAATSAAKRPLARHAAWLMSGSALQAVVAFAANLVLVRLLLPKDFGRYAIVEANVGLVAAVINLRIDAALLRTPKEDLDGERLSVLASALAAQVFLVGAGAFLVLWSFGLLNLAAIILLVASMCSIWLASQVCLYEREFDYRRLSWVETGSQLAGHLLAVLGALVGLGPIVLYLRAAVQQFCRLGGLRSLGSLRWIPLRWLNSKDWKLVIRQVRGFWADGFLEQSFARLVILLVGGLAGQRAAGYFFQARRLAVLPHQLLQPLTFRMAFNYFSHRAPENRQSRILVKGLALAGGGLLLTAVAAVIGAGPVIPWVFGPGWEPVVPLFVAMAGVIVGLTLFNSLKSYCMARAQMQTFMIFGRGVQYIAIGLAALFVWLNVVNASLGLAIGLSSSYVLATLLLLVKVSPFKARRRGITTNLRGFFSYMGQR